MVVEMLSNTEVIIKLYAKEIWKTIRVWIHLGTYINNLTKSQLKFIKWITNRRYKAQLVLFRSMDHLTKSVNLSIRICLKF